MASDRTCPHPTCARGIPREVFACRAHWFQLPARLRARILVAYRRYSRDPAGGVDELIDAQAEADAWWSR